MLPPLDRIQIAPLLPSSHQAHNEEEASGCASPSYSQAVPMISPQLEELLRKRQIARDLIATENYAHYNSDLCNIDAALSISLPTGFKDKELRAEVFNTLAVLRAEGIKNIAISGVDHLFFSIKQETMEKFVRDLDMNEENSKELLIEELVKAANSTKKKKRERVFETLAFLWTKIKRSPGDHLEMDFNIVSEIFIEAAEKIADPATRIKTLYSFLIEKGRSRYEKKEKNLSDHAFYSLMNTIFCICHMYPVDFETIVDICYKAIVHNAISDLMNEDFISLVLEKAVEQPLFNPRITINFFDAVWRLRNKMNFGEAHREMMEKYLNKEITPLVPGKKNDKHTYTVFGSFPPTTVEQMITPFFQEDPSRGKVIKAQLGVKLIREGMRAMMATPLNSDSLFGDLIELKTTFKSMVKEETPVTKKYSDQAAELLTQLIANLSLGSIAKLDRDGSALYLENFDPRIKMGLGEDKKAFAILSSRNYREQVKQKSNEETHSHCSAPEGSLVRLALKHMCYEEEMKAAADRGESGIEPSFSAEERLHLTEKERYRIVYQSLRTLSSETFHIDDLLLHLERIGRIFSTLSFKLQMKAKQVAIDTFDSIRTNRRMKKIEEQPREEEMEQISAAVVRSFGLTPGDGGMIGGKLLERADYSRHGPQYRATDVSDYRLLLQHIFGKGEYGQENVDTLLFAVAAKEPCILNRIFAFYLPLLRKGQSQNIKKMAVMQIYLLKFSNELTVANHLEIGKAIVESSLSLEEKEPFAVVNTIIASKLNEFPLDIMLPYLEALAKNYRRSIQESKHQQDVADAIKIILQNPVVLPLDRPHLKIQAKSFDPIGLDFIGQDPNRFTFATVAETFFSDMDKAEVEKIEKNLLVNMFIAYTDRLTKTMFEYLSPSQIRSYVQLLKPLYQKLVDPKMGINKKQRAKINSEWKILDDKITEWPNTRYIHKIEKLLDRLEERRKEEAMDIELTSLFQEE